MTGRSHTRRGKKRNRNRVLPFCLASLIALAAVAFVAVRSLPLSHVAKPGIAPITTGPHPADQPPLASVTRVYPFSVIPGGVGSAAELKRAVSRDPVVAEHYSDFGVSGARVVALNQGKALYVSYRFGDRIFWTKRRLRLPRGERVITDGVHFARTRCGNRLSEIPRTPVSPFQPADRTLEGPPVAVGHLVPVEELGFEMHLPLELPFNKLPLALVPPGEIGTPPQNLVSPVAVPGPAFVIPPFFVLPSIPGSGGPTRPRPSPPRPVPPVPPPPTPTPEPGTVLLLLTGAGFLYLVAHRRRSRHGSSPS